ncbi:MAG: hypothetical protein FWE93_00920 [Alphaproteobacteria bacterium]|nr:hypothetical protein [Alphaproteobacteria bacterium]
MKEQKKLPEDLGSIDITWQSDDSSIFKVFLCGFKDNDYVSNGEYIEIGTPGNESECVAGEIVCFDDEPSIFIQDIKWLQKTGKYSDYDIAKHIIKTAYITALKKNDLYALAHEKDFISLYDVKPSGRPAKDLMVKALKHKFENSLNDDQIEWLLLRYDRNMPRSEKYLIEPTNESKEHDVRSRYFVLKSGVDKNKSRNFLKDSGDFAGYADNGIFWEDFHILDSMQYGWNGQGLKVKEIIPFFKGIQKVKNYGELLVTKNGDKYIDEKELEVDEFPDEEIIKNRIFSYIRDPMHNQGYTSKQIQTVVDYVADNVLPTIRKGLIYAADCLNQQKL